MRGQAFLNQFKYVEVRIPDVPRSAIVDHRPEHCSQWVNVGSRDFVLLCQTCNWLRPRRESPVYARGIAKVGAIARELLSR